MKTLLPLVCLAVSAAVAAPVEWDFPRDGNCHEGLAFADGVTGTLVWGGGDTVKITVGRADLWDHRGGYPWTPEQSYSNIVASVRSGDRDRLCALFKNVTPPGEPRNPFLVSLGRITVKLPGATLVAGTLDPKTGLGTLDYARGGRTNRAEIAMAKSPRAFAMKFPDGEDFTVDTLPAIEMPAVKAKLKPIGYGPVERIAPRKRIEGGFRWKLPADPAVTLRWEVKDGTLFAGTSRGDAPVSFDEDCTFEAVRSASVAHWRRFWAEGASVTVPDPVIQRIFDYGMYRFGAMTDPDGVPAFFRGCPPEWKTVSFDNIRLSDGRRASGVRRNGKTTVDIRP